jgi:sulfite exporter TauE/SafE
MEPAFWSAILVASVVGSVHCAGMCGPLAVMASGCSCGRQRRECLGYYQGGRLVRYLGLGLIAGAIGAALDLGGRVLGWQQLAAYVAGGSLILMGSITLLQKAGVRLPHRHLPSPVARGISRIRKRLSQLSPRRRALLLGCLTGVLPCGWLYAFVVLAAGTAQPSLGAAVMALFWLGSVPVLLGVSWAANWILGRFHRHASGVTAVLLITVGLLTVSQRTGWTIEGSVLEPSSKQQGLTAEHVNQQTQSLPPCCQP